MGDSMAIDVKARLAKQRQNFDTVEPAELEIMFGDEPLKVRLWPLGGIAWRDLCAQHPNRSESPFDMSLGYNLTGVVIDYPRVFAVDGDDVQDISGEWSEIVLSLSGPDVKTLEMIIWSMNEYDPAQRLAAAGKASAGSRKKKRS